VPFRCGDRFDSAGVKPISNQSSLRYRFPSARKELQQMGIDYTETQFSTYAAAGDMLAVKLFLDGGMDVNAGASAALGLAAGRGQLEMVKLLLARGAKPSASALQFARTRGHKEI
jgi:hypothetical protein